MLTQLVFHLRFVGGPQDGLSVYATDLPDTRLLFPSSQSTWPTPLVAYSRLPGTAAAIYRFDRTEVAGTSSDSVPVMHFHFEGCTSVADRRGAARSHCHWLPATAVARMKNWVERLRQIMVAPVRYPLQVSQGGRPGSPARMRGQ